MVAELITHDWTLRFRSLNHAHAFAINTKAGLLDLHDNRTLDSRTAAPLRVLLHCKKCGLVMFPPAGQFPAGLLTQLADGSTVRREPTRRSGLCCRPMFQGGCDEFASRQPSD